MSSCIYAGSFDPITNGHVDIIKRAARLFDTVYIAVLNNSAKTYMFTLEQRFLMAREASKQVTGVQIVSSDGLLVELMKKLNTSTIVRGLRSNADLELEQQLAVVNAKLLEGVETVVLLSRPELQFISSTIVRELIIFKADLSEYVPCEIVDIIYGGKTI